MSFGVWSSADSGAVVGFDSQPVATAAEPTAATGTLAATSTHERREPNFSPALRLDGGDALPGLTAAATVLGSRSTAGNGDAEQSRWRRRTDPAQVLEQDLHTRVSTMASPDLEARPVAAAYSTSPLRSQIRFQLPPRDTHSPWQSGGTGDRDRRSGSALAYLGTTSTAAVAAHRPPLEAFGSHRSLTSILPPRETLQRELLDAGTTVPWNEMVDPGPYGGGYDDDDRDRRTGGRGEDDRFYDDYGSYDDEGGDSYDSYDDDWEEYDRRTDAGGGGRSVHNLRDEPPEFRWRRRDVQPRRHRLADEIPPQRPSLSTPSFQDFLAEARARMDQHGRRAVEPGSLRGGGGGGGGGGVGGLAAPRLAPSRLEAFAVPRPTPLSSSSFDSLRWKSPFETVVEAPTTRHHRSATPALSTLLRTRSSLTTPLVTRAERGASLVPPAASGTPLSRSTGDFAARLESLRADILRGGSPPLGSGVDGGDADAVALPRLRASESSGGRGGGGMGAFSSRRGDDGTIAGSDFRAELQRLRNRVESLERSVSSSPSPEGRSAGARPRSTNDSTAAVDETVPTKDSIAQHLEIDPANVTPFEPPPPPAPRPVPPSHGTTTPARQVDSNFMARSSSDPVVLPPRAKEGKPVDPIEYLAGLAKTKAGGDAAAAGGAGGSAAAFVPPPPPPAGSAAFRPPDAPMAPPAPPGPVASTAGVGDDDKPLLLSDLGSKAS